MGLGYSKKVHRSDARAYLASTIDDRRKLVKRIQERGPCGTNILFETFALVSSAQVVMSSAMAGDDKREIAAARREYRRAWVLARNAAKRCGR